MEITKSKGFHAAIGSASIVMLVLSILLAVGAIASPVNSVWAWAILVICFSINIIEMVIYFMFENSEISLMLCKWLNIFIAIILFVVNTIGFVASAGAMFANFAMGWVAFLVMILTYIVIGAMVVYFIFAVKESKQKDIQDN